MIISRTKRAFKVKQKTIFLASQVLSFRRAKQTTKNIAVKTFKSYDICTSTQSHFLILCGYWTCMKGCVIGASQVILHYTCRESTINFWDSLRILQLTTLDLFMTLHKWKNMLYLDNHMAFLHKGKIKKGLELVSRSHFSWNFFIKMFLL